MERMMFINCLQHWVRQTFLYYLIIGVTYLVLLEEEKSGSRDWGMLGNIFGNGIVGVAIMNWWLATYKAAFMKADS